MMAIGKTTQQWFAKFGLRCTVLALSTMLCGQVFAAWYEAQGYATIVAGNRDKARQQATQAALKQALMFAGASVSSVQTITNGLLAEDRLMVTASGEVNQVELVRENWDGDNVTVTLRADIFPQQSECSAADYIKTITTTQFPIQQRQQALDGQIQQLGEALPTHLQMIMQHDAQHSMLANISPYSAAWDNHRVVAQAPQLARQMNTQFVLSGVIEDVSLHRPASAGLAFWRDDTPMRTFRLRAQLIDAANGATLLNDVYQTQAIWELDRFSSVDVHGQQFWQSPYGTAITELLENLVQDVDAKLACHPATGRVLAIADDQLQVSIGRSHGVKIGDELSLYQLQQLSDNFGNPYIQYRLHPIRVRVIEAFANSATVASLDGSLLGNVQPNDFVAKRN